MSLVTLGLTLPRLGSVSLSFSKAQGAGPMQQALDVLDAVIKEYWAKHVRRCSLGHHQHVSALQSSLTVLTGPATCAQGDMAPRPVIVFDDAQALKDLLPVQDLCSLLQWMAQVCAAWAVGAWHADVAQKLATQGFVCSPCTSAFVLELQSQSTARTFWYFR
jgi:hypothetical protein